MTEVSPHSARLAPRTRAALLPIVVPALPSVGLAAQCHQEAYDQVSGLLYFKKRRPLPANVQVYGEGRRWQPHSLSVELSRLDLGFQVAAARCLQPLQLPPHLHPHRSKRGHLLQARREVCLAAEVEECEVREAAVPGPCTLRLLPQVHHRRHHVCPQVGGALRQGVSRLGDRRHQSAADPTVLVNLLRPAQSAPPGRLSATVVVLARSPFRQSLLRARLFAHALSAQRRRHSGHDRQRKRQLSSHLVPLHQALHRQRRCRPPPQCQRRPTVAVHALVPKQLGRPPGGGQHPPWQRQQPWRQRAEVVPRYQS